METSWFRFHVDELIPKAGEENYGNNNVDNGDGMKVVRKR